MGSKMSQWKIRAVSSHKKFGQFFELANSCVKLMVSPQLLHYSFYFLGPWLDPACPHPRFEIGYTHLCKLLQSEDTINRLELKPPVPRTRQIMMLSIGLLSPLVQMEMITLVFSRMYWKIQRRYSGSSYTKAGQDPSYLLSVHGLCTQQLAATALSSSAHPYSQGTQFTTNRAPSMTYKRADTSEKSTCPWQLARLKKSKLSLLSPVLFQSACTQFSKLKLSAIFFRHLFLDTTLHIFFWQFFLCRMLIDSLTRYDILMLKHTLLYNDV